MPPNFFVDFFSTCFSIPYPRWPMLVLLIHVFLGMLSHLTIHAYSAYGRINFMSPRIKFQPQSFCTERVKVMMQAQQNSLYANELECIQAVLQNEGWTGLFSRGLGPTLAREIPSYAIYFVVYGVLMQTAVAENLGSVAPLVFGAMR